MAERQTISGYSRADVKRAHREGLFFILLDDAGVREVSALWLLQRWSAVSSYATLIVVDEGMRADAILAFESR
jgi:hypothetical protein